MMKKKGILIVISGFSGAGKGTIVKRLLERYSENYALSVSMTTRNPRENERDGIEYFFADRETFEEKIKKDGFVEYATYCDNYYGTPRDYVEEQLEAGKDVILEIEIQGALQIKKKFPESLLLFVTPPDAMELERRLVGRGTESAEVIQKRMARACEEAEYMDRYDYIIVNDVVDVCVDKLHQVVETVHTIPCHSKELIEEVKEGLKSYQEGAK